MEYIDLVEGIEDIIKNNHWIVTIFDDYHWECHTKDYWFKSTGIFNNKDEAINNFKQFAENRNLTDYEIYPKIAQ